MKVLPAIAAVLGVAGVGVQGGWEARVQANGEVNLLRDGRPAGTLTPGLFSDGWRGAEVGAARSYPEDDRTPRRGRIRTHDGKIVACELSVSQDQEGLRLRYRLAPEQAVRLNSLHVSFDAPASVLAGLTYDVDGDRGRFPDAHQDVHLRAAQPTRRVRIEWPDEDALVMTFGTPCPVLLQDNRQWGPSFCVRMGPQMAPAERWPANRDLVIDLRLSAPTGIDLTLAKPVVITAGDDWVPLETELDIIAASALDFSRFRPTGAPAGIQGRVIATRQGHFAFTDAPDAPCRFYGVNFCFTAQFPEKDVAGRLAERLMRLGYNAVRFHHHERPLVDRSSGTSITMNAEALDRFDFFIAELKKRGLYMTTDLYVSRPVFAREIWPGAEGDVEMNEFKMLVPVNERAFANFMAWTRAFLEHRNPYTEMRYADEPALAWINLINEGNPGNFIRGLSTRAAADWQAAWNAWLLARYTSDDGLAAAWGNAAAGHLAEATVPLPVDTADDSPVQRDLAIFLAETERDFFERVKQIIRNEIRSQVLLTNMNGWSNVKASQLARQAYDYVDDHFYVDHPRFLEQRWRLPSRCPNTSPVARGAPGGRHTAFTRLLDKPFTISEFNYSGPGRYRGVGGILTGCMAALQDWAIVWRFAYSHNRNNLFEVHPAGYFDLVSDPLNLAADRATLCLFLRGDMAPAGITTAITMDPDHIRSSLGVADGLVPDWSELVALSEVGTFLGPRDARVPADLALPESPDAPARAAFTLADPYEPDRGERIIALLRENGLLPERNRTSLAERRVESANGEFMMDGTGDIMVLNTPKTAGCFAQAGKGVVLSHVDFQVDGADATVWVSSLDDLPIPESRHLLVTHLTDLQNSGCTYAEAARRTLLKWGRTPHLVRDGTATVTLRRPVRNATLYDLSTSGKRRSELPVDITDEALVLPLQVRGPDGARIVYELMIDRDE